jgi:hypothetical protein
MPEKTSLSVLLSFPDEGLPTPVAANVFRISRVDTDAELLIGFIDLGTIADAADSSTGPKKLNVEVLQRLILGRRAFVDLREKIEEIYKGMKETGAFAGLPTKDGGDS